MSCVSISMAICLLQAKTLGKTLLGSPSLPSLLALLYLINWIHKHTNQLGCLCCGIGIHLTGRGYFSRLETLRNDRLEQRAILLAGHFPSINIAKRFYSLPFIEAGFMRSCHPRKIPIADTFNKLATGILNSNFTLNINHKMHIWL